MTIDLRSDTVTKPSKGMLEAMMCAKVGDDVFGEDPSINELEKLSAEMFGMDEALFCPSGSMTNQSAIKCHTQPGDEVICDEDSHIYQYEGGGIAFNSGASVKLLKGNLGRITAAHVKNAINPDDVHKPVSSLVSLENTCNRGGGSCYDFEELKRIKKVCTDNNLSLHLDGARLWNALVAKNEKPEQYGKIFDSISVCLSKGMGCPAGSLLIGKKDFIRKARRFRKVFGGGMRQAGFLAAAGIYALKNNFDRLKIDHLHAKQIGEAVSKKSFVKNMFPVETNFIIFEVIDSVNADDLVKKFGEQSILCYTTTATHIRFVVHLDITEEMVSKAIEIVNKI